MKKTYREAMEIAIDFIDKFLVGKNEIAGSLRRKEDLIGDVDIVTNDPLSHLLSRFKTRKLKYKVEEVAGGDAKLDIDYRGMRFNIFYAEPSYWGSMMFYLTGPGGYGIAYRRRAKERGWKLNQYGLFNENGKLIASKTETDIYHALGKEYKSPELRGK